MELFATDRERLAFLLETPACHRYAVARRQARCPGPGLRKPRSPTCAAKGSGAAGRPGRGDRHQGTAAGQAAEVHYRLHRVEAEAGRLDLEAHAGGRGVGRRRLLGLGRGDLHVQDQGPAGPGQRPAALLLPRRPGHHREPQPLPRRRRPGDG